MSDTDAYIVAALTVDGPLPRKIVARPQKPFSLPPPHVHGDVVIEIFSGIPPAPGTTPSATHLESTFYPKSFGNCADIGHWCR
jgi:hypothetical protein